MYYDMHIHTSASDGVFSAAEVLYQACRMGLPGIAITDHDTVEGLPTAWSCLNSEQLNLELISGIELNTEVEDGEIHILGYFIDFECQQLIKDLELIKTARFERAQRMVARLREMGYAITFEQVQRLARKDLIARPHIATALMEKGYVSSIREAFNKLIGRGCPAYVPRYRFTPERAIELIHIAGGISVLAHPGLLRQPRLVDLVLEMGVEGIEAFYPEHTFEDTNYFVALAEQRGLLITGGSDFHGNAAESSRNRLGCCGINAEYMDKIKAYYREIMLKR